MSEQRVGMAIKFIYIIYLYRWMGFSVVGGK